MNARAMLEQAVAENASDIFLVAGRPLSLRKTVSFPWRMRNVFYRMIPLLS